VRALPLALCGLVGLAFLLSNLGVACTHERLDQFNGRKGAIRTIEPIVCRRCGSNLGYLSGIVRSRIARDIVPCDNEDCWTSSFYIHVLRFFGRQSAQPFQGRR
jgi:hypothetical protein